MKPPRDLAATALLAVFTAPLSGAGPETVVVLPFTNLSGVERAPSEIAASFCRRIARKGYSTAPADEVEAFLAAERVRYLDSLSGRVREKLLSKFGASAVIFGTVYSFAEGENAIVGLSARMLRTDGGVAWAGVAALSGEETEGLLGLGRVSSTAAIAEKAVERLLRNFPAPGKSAKLVSARARPLARAGPVTYRASTLESGRVHTICLLPLENRSSARFAPRAVGELLSQRLGASKTFRVVEPGNFREAMAASGVRGVKTGDPAELAKLSKALGTSLFLRGTIYVFKDGSPRNAAVPPELDLDLALVDAAAGRIVWTSRLSRSGRDYESLLELGAISNIVTLADQVAAEMVRAADNAKGRGRRPATASATASNKTYDGSATATITSCTLSGVLARDSANVSCSVASASFSDANAGDGKTVTASGITLSGGASGNYALSSTTATTTANINRKPVTASATASNKTYDGSATATITSCTLSGVLAGDSANVSCSAASASFSDTNAGDGKAVTASGIALSGNTSGNYALSSTTATTTANINRKPVTASVTASNKTYEGTNSASIASCTLSGVLAGDSANVGCSAANASFSDANAGTGKTVTASRITLSGNASGNYVLTSTMAMTTADITPKSVTASITASDKVYDGTAAAITNCALTGVIASDTGNVGCLASSSAFSDKNVGMGKAVTASVGLTDAAADNYVVTSTSATTTAGITARTLTVSGVTANNKIYDGTPAASLTTSGAALVNKVSGDDDSLNMSSAEGMFADKNVGTGKTVTVSGLTTKGGDASNYTLTQPTAYADIAPKSVTPHVTANNRVYDGTTAATLSGQTPAGVLATDASDVSLMVTAANFDTKNVGTGRTVTATGLSLSGSASGNYALSSTSTTTTANVTAKHITGSFTASDKVYDGSTSATVLTRSLNGTNAGDAVSLSGGTATFSDKNVGTGKTVGLQGASLSGADARNYVLDSVATTTANITAKHVAGGFTASDNRDNGKTVTLAGASPARPGAP